MATGIVAVASYLETDVRWLARGLTFLNAAIFIVLSVLILTRAIRYPRQILGDLKDFKRGPGFFTIVAGTAVLGSQMLVILDRPAVAFVLWLIAIPLWACFMYAIFIEFTINEHKPRFEEGMNGGWLIYARRHGRPVLVVRRHYLGFLIRDLLPARLARVKRCSNG